MKAAVLTILLVFVAVSKAEDLYVEETGENEIIPIGNVQFIIHFILAQRKVCFCLQTKTMR